MLQYGFPVLFGIAVWWISTGLLLYLVWQPEASRVRSMAVMTGVLPLGLWALAASSAETTVPAAYISFAAALVLWAWHEMSFLLGLVTGPRTTSCDKTPTERAPLLNAIETVIYHELAIVATAALALALTWNAPNKCGTWTFGILSLMRLSTKLNIYLGVPNVTEDFLPKHLGYLKSYFCRRPMNALFPISITMASTLTVVLAQAALHAAATPFETVGFGLLATFAALGVIEHWFLVLPLPAAELWNWTFRKAKTKGDAATRAYDEMTFPASPVQDVNWKSLARDSIDTTHRATAAVPLRA